MSRRLKLAGTCSGPPVWQLAHAAHDVRRSMVGFDTTLVRRTSDCPSSWQIVVVYGPSLRPRAQHGDLAMAESIHGEALVCSADDAAQRDAPPVVETWIGSLVKRARRVTWWWTRGEHDAWYRQVRAYACEPRCTAP